MCINDINVTGLFGCLINFLKCSTSSHSRRKVNVNTGSTVADKLACTCVKNRKEG